jgi:hypothetical protein
LRLENRKQKKPRQRRGLKFSKGGFREEGFNA